MELIIKSAVSFYALWIGYLACMSLVLHKHELSKPALIMGWPVIITFIIADAVVNAVVFSFLFIEPPWWHKREFLVTGRLKRHARHGNGWRSRLARFLCHSLLDQFDPSGRHC